ncbi:MAG: DUF1080 domain-containing protein [Burkholderiales bacterium]
MTTKSLSGITATLLVAFAAFGCAHDMSGMAGPGWNTLFDGKNIDQWHQVGDVTWRIEDGAVVADKKTGKNNGFLVTNRSYQDFELHAEFWVSHDANSGIYMRCQSATALTDKTCYEANIFDERKDPTFGTGALVHIAKVVPMPKAGGKWNTYDITVKGTHIVLVLNGVKTVDVESDLLKSGPIGLQYAAGVVKFRNVRIKEL